VKELELKILKTQNLTAKQLAVFSLQKLIKSIQYQESNKT